MRLSDVYSFSGTGSDIFVLELSMTSVEAGSYLAWLYTDGGTHNWGERGARQYRQQRHGGAAGYAGSFAAFQSIYGTQLSDYLGAYGTDTATGSTWAVINHNSDFSIVPEPSTRRCCSSGGAWLSPPRCAAGAVSAWRTPWRHSSQRSHLGKTLTLHPTRTCTYENDPHRIGSSILPEIPPSLRGGSAGRGGDGWRAGADVYREDECGVGTGSLVEAI